MTKSDETPEKRNHSAGARGHGKIRLKGCRENNLRNLELEVPKEQLVSFVGVSGCGKSSLALDTIYAEAQRRFFECLSPELRHSVRMMPRPDVDLIEGLSPCLALGQGHGRLNPWVSVGQHTDLNDLLAVLFAACGRWHSPVTGEPLVALSRQEMIDRLMHEVPEKSRIEVMSPMPPSSEPLRIRIERLLSLGFVRIRKEGEMISLDAAHFPDEQAGTFDVVIDRLVMKEGVRERLASSLETALNLSRGIVLVSVDGNIRTFMEALIDPATSERFESLTPRHFSTGSAVGACATCSGSGGKSNERERGCWESCSACEGSGLQRQARLVRWRQRSWIEWQSLTLKELLQALQAIGDPNRIEREMLPEIINRLEFLCQVGLGYVTLERRAGTLSDGEDHRVQLAGHIGAKLSGICYVLDDPTSGLHHQDILHLALALEQIVALGNTVLVLDNDRTLVTHSDHVIELGPGAGPHGGQLTFQGDVEQLLQSNTLTGRWLSGRELVAREEHRKGNRSALVIEHAQLHNLKGVSTKIPLGLFCALCGVSGSGKSTLALDLILPAVRRWIAEGEQNGVVRLVGRSLPERVVEARLEEAARNPRSMVATAMDLMTPLRQLFSQTKLARARGYTPSRFSLNRTGGRCEHCEGMGTRRVKLALLPDLYLPCEVCEGRRYNTETLQCQWQGKSMAEVLDLTVEQASIDLQLLPQFHRPLRLLFELGLGYLRLGQSLPSLSYGEVQRLRLASELMQPGGQRTLYILDEPCSGLHPAEVALLVQALHRLVDAGHSVLVIDHSLDCLAQADLVIELGPGGGPEGGHLLFQGTPEELSKQDTPTGRALRGSRCL